MDILLLIAFIILLAIFLVIIIPATSSKLNLGQFSNDATGWLRERLKEPSPNIVKYKKSRPTSQYERGRTRVVPTLTTKNYTSHDFDNPYTPFPPSSYTKMFISKANSKNDDEFSSNLYDSNRKVNDNSLIENMRIYHQNQNRKYEKPSPNALKVDEITQQYWKENSPNSKKRLIESAMNPKVQYVKVVPKPSKHADDDVAATDAKSQAPAKPTSGFQLPSFGMPSQPKPASSGFGFNTGAASTSSSGFSFNTGTSSTSSSGFGFNTSAASTKSSTTSTSSSGFSFNTGAATSNPFQFSLPKK